LSPSAGRKGDWEVPFRILSTATRLSCLSIGTASWRRYMELRKYGVEIACEQCQLIRGDSAGDFDIVVPVSMGDTGMAGTARHHCALSRDRHQVELMELRDTRDCAVQPSPEAMDKLSAALDSVARHRICGNQHICPPDGVRIVAGRGITADAAGYPPAARRPALPPRRDHRRRHRHAGTSRTPRCRHDCASRRRRSPLRQVDGRTATRRRQPREPGFDFPQDVSAARATPSAAD